MLLAELIDEFPLSEQEDWKVPENNLSTKEIPISDVGTKTVQTSVNITFDESIPKRKIEKFIDNVDEEVKAACTSSSSFDDRGED